MTKRKIEIPKGITPEDFFMKFVPETYARESANIDMSGYEGFTLDVQFNITGEGGGEFGGVGCLLVGVEAGLGYPAVPPEAVHLGRELERGGQVRCRRGRRHRKGEEHHQGRPRCAQPVSRGARTPGLHTARPRRAPAVLPTPCRRRAPAPRPGAPTAGRSPRPARRRRRPGSGSSRPRRRSARRSRRQAPPAGRAQGRRRPAASRSRERPLRAPPRSARGHSSGCGRPPC